MKVCSINREAKEILLSLDYWEAESLGYDVLTNTDRSGTYFSRLQRNINDIVSSFFGVDYHYGIKSYRDSEKVVFYYHITPYEKRLA